MNILKHFYLFESTLDNSLFLIYESYEDIAKLKFYNLYLCNNCDIDTEYKYISNDTRIYIVESLYSIEEADSELLCKKIGYDYVNSCIETNNILTISDTTNLAELSHTINETIYLLSDRLLIFNSSESTNCYFETTNYNYNDSDIYVYELTELKTNKILAYVKDIGSDAVCATIYDNFIKTSFDIVHNIKETDTKQTIVESLINDFDMFTINMIKLSEYSYDRLNFINNYYKVSNFDTSIYDVSSLNNDIDKVIRNICHLEDDEIIE